jgi:predicted nucleotide-binding protein
MSGDEISEEGRAARFERWEKLGLDRVKSDLVNGGHQLIGGPSQVRELAWEWVRMKEAEAARVVPPYTQAAAEAVYAAIEALIAAGKRAYSLSVPMEAEKILVQSGRGRINSSEAHAQTKAAIVGLATEGKIEIPIQSRMDWVIREPLAQELVKMATPRRKIFIVHGHDGTPKAEVARFIEKVGLEAVILHERPNKGRTLITKFQEEAGTAEFAVVLMTPDDLGKAAAATDLNARARQNVVFELGFFIGKLGPERVAALVKGDVEKPSDFDGVFYISLYCGVWQKMLGQELQAAGYEIDWNLVMGTASGLFNALY